MKKTYSTFKHIYTLCLTTFLIIFSTSMGHSKTVEIEKMDIGTTKIKVECHSDSFYEQMFFPHMRDRFGRLIKNLSSFEEEILSTRFFKNKETVFYFTIPENFSASNFAPFSIKIIGPSYNNEPGMELEYNINLLNFFPDNQIYRLRISPKTPEKAIEQLYYDIYNLKWTLTGRLESRTILTLVHDQLHPNSSKQYIFKEGLDVLYGKFNEVGLPNYYLYKYFTLDRNGLKTLLRSKECKGRSFDEKGLLKQESVSETTYTYKKTSPYYTTHFFNLLLHPSGHFQHFDYATKWEKQSNSDKSPPKEEFYSISFHDDPETKTSKILERRYDFLSSGKKSFLRGHEIISKFALKKLWTQNTEFSIVPGKQGFSIKDRLNEKGKIIFYPAEKSDSLKRRLIEFEILPLQYKGTTLRLKKLSSYREVFLTTTRQQLTPHLKDLYLQYYYFNDQLEWTPYRKVLAKNIFITPKPLSIKELDLTIEDIRPFYSSSSKRINNDCKYILDEIFDGALFTPEIFLQGKDLHLLSFNDNGNLEQVRVFYYKEKDGIKNYFDDKIITVQQKSKQ